MNLNANNNVSVCGRDYCVSNDYVFSDYFYNRE